MQSIRLIFLCLAVFTLINCGGSSGESSSSSSSGGGGSSSSSSSGGPGGSSVEKLSMEEYNALPDNQKYIVMNKLMATLYKGVALKDFFDLSGGISNLVVRDGADTIGTIEASMNEPLTNKETYYDLVDEKYNFDTTSYWAGYKTQQYPSAVLFELPLSKDYFEFWVAYRLANTILFSPAVELESVDYVDIQRVMYRLTMMMEEGKSIQEIVYEHMISQENWRRFRSPEDNTREMMEIFLARFNDEEVPKAAIACKNWYLTDGGQDYQLVIDFNENTEPQDILDTTVTTCYDFYQAVSTHASLLPRIVSVLVDVFFTDYSDAEKSRFVTDIVATNPTTFQEIFKTIILSREYLLNNDRAKKYEEAFFNVAHRITWFANRNYFRNLNRRPERTSFETLGDMKQEALAYKLGRSAEVPVDSLSFAFYHKSARERVLIDLKRDEFNQNDGGWQADFIDVPLDGDDFIQYLFLSVLSRTASTDELTTLNNVIVNRGYDGNTLTDKQRQARIVLDYLSRLSELYFFRAVS